MLCNPLPFRLRSRLLREHPRRFWSPPRFPRSRCKRRCRPPSRSRRPGSPPERRSRSRSTRRRRPRKWKWWALPRIPPTPGFPDDGNGEEANGFGEADDGLSARTRERRGSQEVGCTTLKAGPGAQGIGDKPRAAVGISRAPREPQTVFLFHLFFSVV